MSFTVIIPARYASTRLPGKPLLDIAGRPMIRHVIEQAARSGARQVCVATDDVRIRGGLDGCGHRVIMTGETHQSGTDRVEEAARVLGLADDDIVVNVQGDEPLIEPALIDQVADALSRHRDAGISSIYEPLTADESVDDPALVKVVVDHEGYALYFSRSPLPWQQEARLVPLRHLGIYAYRVATLRRFVAWPAADLERAERLEQLRALANGVRIHMSRACVASSGGVDTERDLERVRRWFLTKAAGAVEK